MREQGCSSWWTNMVSFKGTLVPFYKKNSFRPCLLCALRRKMCIFWFICVYLKPRFHHFSDDNNTQTLCWFNTWYDFNEAWPRQNYRQLILSIYPTTLLGVKVVSVLLIVDLIQLPLFFWMSFLKSAFNYSLPAALLYQDFNKSWRLKHFRNKSKYKRDQPIQSSRWL